jgi:deoxyribodipyrimidine photo-lyase
MTCSIWWLRRDLRLTDNPALQQALARSETVIPLYIFAPEEEIPWALGAASRWWLHHSLSALDRDLRRLGSRLLLRHGPSLSILLEVAQECGAGRVYWNRLYEPQAVARDTGIKQNLRQQGLQVETYNASLLAEPWEVTSKSAAPYKVFTPFWKALQARGLTDLPPLAEPSALPEVPFECQSLSLEALALLPKLPWDGGLAQTWRPGEAGALARMDTFITDALAHYATDRDQPGHPGTSGLAPHLHFGEISPRQIVWALQGLDTAKEASNGAASFIRQLGWREFAHHLLFYFPATTENPMDGRFSDFAWNPPEPTILQAWQQGRTGIPLVDAGMRELWQTGGMHNRVRMVAGSFLVKNLRLHWLEGARWFWDTLVDADLANNTLGWQWVAGCGADAAPYFRIFNPVLQGQRFDPEGRYVRRWVPELSRLPDRYLQQPWTAPEAVLVACGVRLGRDYPFPIIDLKTSREQALAAFKQVGGRGGAAPIPLN